MPHRDQAEAMRARIEALEQRLKETKREAADERARLEAELAEARKEHARRESPVPAPGAPSTSERRTTEELLSETEREALLWSGELDDRIGYLTGEAAVVVTLRDGSRLVLDGGEARPFEGELPPIPTVPNPSSATVPEMEDGQVLRLEASDGDERHVRRLQPSGSLTPRRTPWCSSRSTAS